MLDVRSHDDGDCRSEAVFSECGTYRYRLTRTWDANRGRLLYIMLNPSKACERKNDPTIARCQKRAELLGYGGLDVVNLFAFRATDPADLRAAVEPVGPENDATLIQACGEADCILAAWGVHGRHQGRDQTVMSLLNGAGHSLHVLGLTRHGLPRHPLYVSYANRPEPWSPSALTN
ncbi:DUF1643 domain-containing protein [Primorskyibacter aestuariivivens]|uniref:DUF1643 domain-containing protein n=1 Tax=Primorskyibacter aestuariivivens TaxID=1888912 RepID=UPI002301ECF8|nr:DUF1643 domain-containing protein [Primorskyibacter aestuariivivens]MDA7429425.1 DUF1643 domain-containing protein [Primorskyibacter aestuariivivens]